MPPVWCGRIPKRQESISSRALRILSLAKPTQTRAEHDLIIERFLWLKVDNWRACGKIAKLVHRKAITSDRLQGFYARLVKKQAEQERRRFGVFLNEMSNRVREQFRMDSGEGAFMYENERQPPSTPREEANRRMGNLRFIGELCLENSGLRNPMVALVRMEISKIMRTIKMEHNHVALVVGLLKYAKMHLLEAFQWDMSCYTEFTQWLEDESKTLPLRTRMVVETLVDQLRRQYPTPAAHETPAQ